jgi:hypothetical protein
MTVISPNYNQSSTKELSSAGSCTSGLHPAWFSPPVAWVLNIQTIKHLKQ